jgi:hypothetical protein
MTTHNTPGGPKKKKWGLSVILNFFSGHCPGPGAREKKRPAVLFCFLVFWGCVLERLLSNEPPIGIVAVGKASPKTAKGGRRYKQKKHVMAVVKGQHF